MNLGDKPDLWPKHFYGQCHLTLLNNLRLTIRKYFLISFIFQRPMDRFYLLFCFKWIMVIIAGSLKVNVKAINNLCKQTLTLSDLTQRCTNLNETFFKWLVMTNQIMLKAKVILVWKITCFNKNVNISWNLSYFKDLWID